MVKTAISKDAGIVLEYLMRCGNAACNQEQVVDGTGLQLPRVARALQYLVQHGKVVQSVRSEPRPRPIKYYSAVSNDTPSSSVLVK